MRIAAAIITLNEQERLPACLESLEGVADEIVILDSFSSDNTASIAREFGAKFHQSAFRDYADQRNKLLKLCESEWVLSLDADERVSPELGMELMALKEEGAGSYDGFLIRRRTWHLGRWIMHCGWYPQQKVRLFKKESASWEGAVHERLIKNGNFGRLRGDILHYSYRDISDQLARVHRYALMQAGQQAGKSAAGLLARMLISPFLRFVRDYFLKLGFLDGFAGFTIARMNSFGVFLRYLFALELKIRQRQQTRGS